MDLWLGLYNQPPQVADICALCYKGVDSNKVIIETDDSSLGLFSSLFSKLYKFLFQI